MKRKKEENSNQVAKKEQLLTVTVASLVHERDMVTVGLNLQPQEHSPQNSQSKHHNLNSAKNTNGLYGKRGGLHSYVNTECTADIYYLSTIIYVKIRSYLLQRMIFPVSLSLQIPERFSL